MILQLKKVEIIQKLKLPLMITSFFQNQTFMKKKGNYMRILTKLTSLFLLTVMFDTNYDWCFIYYVIMVFDLRFHDFLPVFT